MQTYRSQGAPGAELVTLERVKKRYPDGKGGSFFAVADVSLEFHAGEVTAILGPNGAGKTTLIDIILGLNRPDSGSVQVAGATPGSAVRKGKVGALLQTGGLLPDLSVKETVTMVASLQPKHIPVDQAMDMAGITDISGRKISKCSGGQQQRVKFALALLPDPDLIVLDEPTAGMDVSARHDFWDSMRDQADQGKTVLFATHYLEEAEQFARRTVMLHQGAILADGPTAQVQQKAGAAHVKVTWVPNADELAELHRRTSINSSEVEGNRITFRTDDADTLARYLLNETQARGLSIRPASLEEAFMVLTQPEAARQSQKEAR